MLLCATVVQSVDITKWGALNANCVLLPNLAPTDTETAVVMPQTKASLYFTSDTARAAIEGFLSSPVDWQPVLDLITNEK
ncbi:hypothetical protein CCR75_002380 [Bremia lactucae]|uniref:Uncharacterized protein n=1 Tax=Bremia lactucae TaxID=4779 RepID=A0A976IET6_BRELC|nr:hypothetical protein CCR75_002380 [Bremia lactucae]